MAESILSAPALILSTVREIPLTQGKVALVDAADYEWLNQWKWCTRVSLGGKCFYAMRANRKPCGLKSTLQMHRVIMGVTDPAICVDHANHDGLDNRRENLRLATKAQNGANQKPKPGTSAYKGVYWNKQARRWQAQIRIDGRRVNLGCFSCEKEAAIAYNVAALNHFGDFALINAIG